MPILGNYITAELYYLTACINERVKTLYNKEVLSDDFILLSSVAEGHFLLEIIRGKLDLNEC